MEKWPKYDLDKNEKFVKIAGMHSELIAVTDKGKICQWKWSMPHPYRCPDVSPSLESLDCTTRIPYFRENTF
jgi:hypothetical protein